MGSVRTGPDALKRHAKRPSPQIAAVAITAITTRQLPQLPQLPPAEIERLSLTEYINPSSEPKYTWQFPA